MVIFWYPKDTPRHTKDTPKNPQGTPMIEIINQWYSMGLIEIKGQPKVPQ